MSYHDDVRAVISQQLVGTRPWDQAAKLIDKLPRPLLLAEDGRFVKVEPFWDPMRGGAVPGAYSVVEEP